MATRTKATPPRTARAKETTPPRREASALAVPAPYMERLPVFLGNELTPERLTQLIFRRNEGTLQPWVDLSTEFLGTNPHLVSQMQLRRESVVETRFDVRPGRGTGARAARKAVSALQELLTTWQGRTGEGWEDWLAQITDGVYYGRSLHEVIWEKDGLEVVPESLAWIHPRRLSYACVYNDPDPWTLRIHDPDDPLSPFGSIPYGIPVSDFHPDKFLVHEPSILGVQKTMEGLFVALVWYLLFYTWNFRDLMAAVELLGRPPVIARYTAGGEATAANGKPPRQATEAEIAAADKVVRSVTGALRACIPDTITLEALKFDQLTKPMQLEVAMKIEGLISKVFSGSADTSDLKSGARAAHEVAFMQGLTFWRGDIRRTCRLFTWLGGRYVRANPQRFGEGCPLPEVFSPDLEDARAASLSARTPKGPRGSDGDPAVTAPTEPE